ncbi:MAG: hypothetical protein JXX14_07645 [Deltaproteobacteria bacterium]|nr:hypothetical protein [Deltaproteobacteria bacterium]
MKRKIFFIAASVICCLFLYFGCSENPESTEMTYSTDNNRGTDSATADDTESAQPSDSDDPQTDPQSSEPDTDSSVTRDTVPATPVGEDWEMILTADNYFEVYFGTPLKTEGELVGYGDDWKDEFFFTAEDKRPTDHLYVVTASDHFVAQGFIGVFKNISRNKLVTTGDDVWQVFGAGAYEETNPYWPDPWPANVMPTQEQVDEAITYAHTNGLWATPFSESSYDNDPNTDPTTDGVWTSNPWTADYPNIPDDAMWIWHDSGNVKDGSLPGPFSGGNHDEFLIFRVAGKIEIVVE